MIYDLRFTIGGLALFPRRESSIVVALFILSALSSGVLPARDFEGRIAATLTRGTETQSWLYTVGTNRMRIERTEANWPHPKNIMDLKTGSMTLVFPHNRSFVRFNPSEQSAAPRFPGATGRPLPPGIGPQTSFSNGPSVPPAPIVPANIGPTNLPGGSAPPPPRMPTMPTPPGGLPPGVGPQAGGPGFSPGTPGMPAMPMMPPTAMEPVELKDTGQTTNLLGYTCSRYEIKQRGEVMEIWATDKLLAFQVWTPNQPHRFGPRTLDEQWSGLLKAKKLFPLLATLKFENGQERMRFEVNAITPQKIDDRDGALFQPPPDYAEIQPLPF